MKHIQNLIHKEMTRKEFLATLGFGAATVVGLSSLLAMMGKSNPWQNRNNSAGYGGGSYGGYGRNLS